jgi:putative glycerol-1-phosphate prenyltransferase
MGNLLEIIKKNTERKRKMLAVLLDPDIVCCEKTTDRIISLLGENLPDFIFVGGSHTTARIDLLIEKLKKALDIPLVLFPGNASQFSPRADALLNISLLSGRNADFLIGQHVVSAAAIKRSGIEVIPTAYLLIEGGKTSSVEYMSNTRPVPRDKKQIALSTALAGELLGMQLVYLEAGSGALLPVPEEMTGYVKENISLPLIVGGGIRTAEQLLGAYRAGADLVVAGNVFETEAQKIKDFVEISRSFRT